MKKILKDYRTLAKDILSWANENGLPEQEHHHLSGCNTKIPELQERVAIVVYYDGDDYMNIVLGSDKYGNGVGVLNGGTVVMNELLNMTAAEQGKALSTVRQTWEDIKTLHGPLLMKNLIDARNKKKQELLKQLDKINAALDKYKE